MQGISGLESGRNLYLAILQLTSTFFVVKIKPNPISISFVFHVSRVPPPLSISAVPSIPTTSMEDFSDDKEELLQKCPSCEGEYHHSSAPHTSKRYWIVSIAIHTTIIVFTISILKSFYTPRKIPQKSTSFNPINHDSNLVGTISCKRPLQS